MRITVFTPAYNRGYIIEKLYRSLQNQTFRNFEWLIIDDGSSDNTSEKIQSFIQDNNDFPIIFEKVENGGKHRAINLGVQKARGELFFIVDCGSGGKGYSKRAEKKFCRNLWRKGIFRK